MSPNTYISQLDKYLWQQYANEILWLNCKCNCLEFDIFLKCNLTSWKKNTNWSQKKRQTENDYVQNVIISFQVHVITLLYYELLKLMKTNKKSPLPQYANEYSLNGTFFDFFSFCWKLHLHIADQTVININFYTAMN